MELENDRADSKGEWPFAWSQSPSQHIQAYRKAFLESTPFPKASVDLTVQPDDVFICPSAKCGTTWVSQIVQMLRSGCKMDYEHLADAIPFIEAHKGDLNFPQKWSPRMFKTHALYTICPKGGKYIHVTRHPLDRFMSEYHFTKDLLFNGDDITMEEYIYQNFLSKDAPKAMVKCLTPDPSVPIKDRDEDMAVFVAQLVAWTNVRHDPSVLFLTYEDLKDHTGACIKLIAEFIGLDASEDTIKKVMEMSSIDFMKLHASKIDRNKRRNSKMRTGKRGGYKEVLSPQLIDLYEECWKTQLQPVLNFDSYDDLRASVFKELGLEANTAP